MILTLNGDPPNFKRIALISMFYGGLRAIFYFQFIQGEEAGLRFPKKSTISLR